MSTAFDVGKLGWTAASAASMVSRSIISTAAGTMPQPMIADTASPASSIEAKPASSVSTASGRRRRRSVAFVTTASVPSDPTSTPSRSRPGASSGRTAKSHEIAVGQHRFDAEHVVDREAVLQAVGAARVFGDVAADRADDLARGVGRVVVAERRDAPRDLEVRDARFDGHALVGDVDVTDRGSSARETISTPSGSGSAPPERPVPLPRATNGTPCWWHSRTTAWTSAVVRGRTTNPGVARKCTSASDS